MGGVPLQNVFPFFPYSHLFGQTEPHTHSLRCLLYTSWGSLYIAALAQVMSGHGSVRCPQRQEPAVFTVLLMFEPGKSLLCWLWTPIEILAQCYFENPAISVQVWKWCSLKRPPDFWSQSKVVPPEDLIKRSPSWVLMLQQNLLSCPVTSPYGLIFILMDAKVTSEVLVLARQLQPACLKALL